MGIKLGLDLQERGDGTGEPVRARAMRDRPHSALELVEDSICTSADGAWGVRMRPHAPIHQQHGPEQWPGPIPTSA